MDDYDGFGADTICPLGYTRGLPGDGHSTCGDHELNYYLVGEQGDGSGSGLGGCILTGRGKGTEEYAGFTNGDGGSMWGTSRLRWK